jgi:hypothetical protein
MRMTDAPRRLLNELRSHRGTSTVRLKCAISRARGTGDALKIMAESSLVALTSESNRMTDTDPIGAVVVWRIADGEIAEAWDIPAVHTPHPVRAET